MIKKIMFMLLAGLFITNPSFAETNKNNNECHESKNGKDGKNGESGTDGKDGDSLFKTIKCFFN